MRLPALRPSLVRSVLFPVALAFLACTGSAQAAKPAKSPITLAAEDALWWGDFAAIERQNAEFKQPGRVERDGTPHLDLFRRGLALVFNNKVDNAEAYLTEVDTLTLQWAKANPKSALAHSLHARALVAHAWSYRGGGFAKTVPPEAWKDFHAYLRRAANYLKDNADVALTDSYAHLVLLKIGQGLGWSHEQLAAIANEGLARNPDDFDLYDEMVNNLLPKWSGNPKVLDSYINHVAEQTRARFGMGLYATLYSQAAEDDFGHALFENSHADWSKMKQGYEDMHARYPDSPLRRNRFAYMACIAKDRATLLNLLKELGTKIEVSEWGSNPERSLESCRRWATQL